MLHLYDSEEARNARSFKDHDGSTEHKATPYGFCGIIRAFGSRTTASPDEPIEVTRFIFTVRGHTVATVTVLGVVEKPPQSVDGVNLGLVISALVEVAHRMHRKTKEAMIDAVRKVADEDY